MQQKKCSQCKNWISVTAPTCLYCGRPNKFVTNNYVKRKWDREFNNNKKDFLTILVLRKKIFITTMIVILIIILLNI